jgi:hypothetical protein
MTQTAEEPDDDGTFDPISADRTRITGLRKKLTLALPDIAANVTAAFSGNK